MLRDTARDMIASKIGRRTDLNDDIVTELQLIQRTKLEGKGEFRPWFLESTMTEIGTTTANVESLALPADFLGEIDGQGVWIYEATGDPIWSKLRKDDFDISKERYPTAGKPKRYSLEAGNALIFHPTPDAAYSIRMRYYKKAAALTTNIENLWLIHAEDMLIYETARVMADEHLQNDAMASRFEKKANEAYNRVFTENESRRHTNRFYSMGDD